MLVLINGQAHELPDSHTVADVMDSTEGIPGAGVAVAVDGEVVPRRLWPATRLSDGSRIEIVVAVQGG